MRGDALLVDSVGGPNWTGALELLAEGHEVIYRGVGLTLADYESGRLSLVPLNPLTARVTSRGP